MMEAKIFISFKNSILFLFVVFLNFKYADGQQKIKIMSYNIHHGRDSVNQDQLNNIANLITMSRADIVGLQEVDSVCFRSGKVDQAKILAELTGLYYTYVRHFAFEGGSYGLALLSRFPIAKVINKRLPILMNSFSAKTYGNTRAALLAKIRLKSGKELAVMVVHLDYRSKVSRVRQAKIILKIVKSKNRPVILTGDLNCSPKSKPLIILKKYFRDVTLPHPFTYPSKRPLKKIDYILADIKHFQKKISDSVYQVSYSDHCPILGYVKLSL